MIDWIEKCDKCQKEIKNSDAIHEYVMYINTTRMDFCSTKCQNSLSYEQKVEIVKIKNKK